MNKYICILILITLTISCKKKDPCNDLVNGVYHFPELPDNSGWSREKIDEFWDLPEDVCNCIKTEGLIETCLNYPNLGLINAGANPQSGYTLLIRERFRGVRELENRADRGTYLLKKYKTLDPLGYDPQSEELEIAIYLFNISCCEIIFSQYVNLEPLTQDEKIELIETAIVTYEKSKADTEYIHDAWNIAKTSVLMARIMKLDNYKPFIDVYNESYAVGEVVEFYWPTNYETLELIYLISKEYLQFLKNK
ncbi:MAG: hypothetical protein GY756_15865 [bacterium]|nr:hypothetical protein [bacterium]